MPRAMPELANAVEGGVDSMDALISARSLSVLARMAERGVYLVPTLSILYFRSREAQYEAQRARLDEDSGRVRAACSLTPARLGYASQMAVTR